MKSRPKPRRNYGFRFGKFGAGPARIGQRWQRYEADVAPPEHRHRSQYEELWHAMAHTALLDAAHGYVDASEIDEWEPWAIEAMAVGMRMQAEEFQSLIRGITAEHARYLAEVRVEHPWMVEPAQRYLALRRTRWGDRAPVPKHWLQYAAYHVRPAWLIKAANRLGRGEWRWLAWRDTTQSLLTRGLHLEILGKIGLLIAVALRDIERAIGGASWKTHGS
jgi:hypothetical protein